MGRGRGEKHEVLNLEKSRANSKIMEKVTDEMGRTFTKQVDIMTVQRYFFSFSFLICIKRMEGIERKKTF